MPCTGTIAVIVDIVYNHFGPGEISISGASMAGVKMMRRYLFHELEKENTMGVIQA